MGGCLPAVSLISVKRKDYLLNDKFFINLISIFNIADRRVHTMKRILRFAEGDNVGVALEDISAGDILGIHGNALEFPAGETSLKGTKSLLLISVKGKTSLNTATMSGLQRLTFAGASMSIFTMSGM